jgi:hypothetical protein
MKQLECGTVADLGTALPVQLEHSRQALAQLESVLKLWRPVRA